MERTAGQVRRLASNIFCFLNHLHCPFNIFVAEFENFPKNGLSQQKKTITIMQFSNFIEVCRLFVTSCILLTTLRF